jgi:MscS family membrane protein
MDNISWLWTETAFAGNPLWRIAAFALAVLAGLVAGRLWQVFQRAACDRLDRNGRQISAVGLNVAVSPVTLLAWVAGLHTGEKLLLMGDGFRALVETAMDVLWTVGFFWLAYSEVALLDHWMAGRAKRSGSRMEDMLAPLVRKSARITIVALGLLQMATLLSDKPLTSILAGLGVGGLAVALAGQETVKNLFGSLVIFFDRPFELGDRIQVDGFDGPVEQVGIRSTRIRTLDGSLVTIPNGELANKSIRNIDKRPHIRRVLNLSITYSTPPAKLDRALQILRELLANHEGMRPDCPPRVYFSEFNPDALNIMVLYWYHPPDYWDYMAFSEKLNREILRRFNDEGIAFAFPTRTVYLAQSGEERRQLRHDVPGTGDTGRDSAERRPC